MLLMIRPGKYVLAGVLALPAAGFAAAGLSYSYFEADYVNLDVDAFGDEGDFIDDFDNGDGWGLRGSFAFTDNWFIFGNWSETDADTGFRNDAGLFIPSNQDVKRFDLGIGFNAPLSERLDFVARGAYTDIDFGDFDFGGSDDDDIEDLDDDSTDGFFVDAGVRAQLIDWLEGGVAARYTDLDTGSDIGIVGNLLFELNQNWGLNVEADVADDLATYSFGVRYSFGPY
jgi:hypothetical protein